MDLKKKSSSLLPTSVNGYKKSNQFIDLHSLLGDRIILIPILGQSVECPLNYNAQILVKMAKMQIHLAFSSPYHPNIFSVPSSTPSL